MRTRLFTEGSGSRKLLPKVAYGGRPTGTAFSLKICVKERSPHRFPVAKATLFSSIHAAEGGSRKKLAASQ
jgi:hypothetical protein